ncbi:hypothetical protein V1389_02105 [Flavobacterium rakeshii]|uniref:hypothetical protein n=1 Tax=Flavobacterium rakeshii TaxID=1038845 RepID=UPI002E7AE574|nr:hypothetical protein [Flavobacterium rakeshii]MEE1897110.1 hypothetical protein [Flavobacterium rakeshii]
MEAIYKKQGDRLYRIKGNDIIEINLESYEYGVISLSHGDLRTCPLIPNQYAGKLSPNTFKKYYRAAIKKLTITF